MLIFFKAKILFPAWELFIPSVGIFCSQYGNIFHVTYTKPTQAYISNR